MKVPTFTKTGSKATTEVTLDKAVFGRDVSPELLKAAYTRTLANFRQGTAKTKTRGLISGGGRKPWRQKGTGRARTGSTRNPLWRGGGTIFGPTGEQNYSVSMPKKAIRASIAQALSLKAQANVVHVIETFVVDSGKTKDAVAFLAKLKLEGKVLIVTDDVTAETRRAFDNLATVKLTRTSALTAYDVLNADVMLLTKDATEALSKWLGTGVAK